MELICETLELGEVRELKEKWQGGASLSEKLEFLFRRSLATSAKDAYRVRR
jgi:hypothetical protein